MFIELKQHTILLMVGPSGCGKSTLAKHIQSQISKCSIVNSDDLRRELLLYDHNEMSPIMGRASEEAFKLLKLKVDSYSSYPINHNLIIVDSTGLSEQFRNDIKDIAKKNNYNFLVCAYIFNDRKDYFTYAKSKVVTEKHVQKLLREQVAKLGKDKIIIKNHDLPDFKMETPSNKVDGSALIVGDVHGCYDELMRLLENPKLPTYDHLIFVGDLIDKGPYSDKVIDWVSNNDCKVVLGNHENFVVKYWLGEIEQEINDIIRDNFDSVFNKDTKFVEQLCQVYNYSYPWLEGENFIVTHAPCHKNELGKLRSIKQQRNFRHIGLDDLVDSLQFLYEEDRYNYPKHIFGHIPFNKTIHGKSFIGLDTNCVGGGRLTSVFMNGFDKPMYYSVPSKKYFECTPNTMDKQVGLNELSNIKDYRLALQCIRNKVNYISGTICPGDKYEI